MNTRLAVLVVLLVTLAGCAPMGSAQPSTFPDGSSVHTINVGGLDRSYRVYKPAGLPAAAPLVVMLHGGFGTAGHAEKAYGWDQLADSAKSSSPTQTASDEPGTPVAVAAAAPAATASTTSVSSPRLWTTSLRTSRSIARGSMRPA